MTRAPRSPRPFPLPVRDALRNERDLDHEAVLWARIQRARPKARHSPGVALPVPLSEVLRDEASDAAVQLRYRRLRRARKTRRSFFPSFLGRPALALGVLSLMLAGALLGTVLVRRSSLAPLAAAPPAASAPGPLRLTNGGPLAAVEAMDEDVELAFSDASKVRLAPHTRLVPLASTAERVDLLLEEGRALFSVTPDGPRRWTIEAGAARVEVVGTVFEMERRRDHVVVRVSRGVVLVRSGELANGVQRLEAGQSVALGSAPQGIADASSAASSEPALPAAQEGPAPPRVEREKTPADKVSLPNKPRSRRDNLRANHTPLPEDGATLDAASVKRSIRKAGQADELLKLADTARQLGDPQTALLALERILSDFRDSSHAPLAAFTLGRIHLDSLGSPKAAAVAFERAIALNPPLALLEDCHARLVRAHALAGHRAEAVSTATRYRALFPNGRYLKALDRWLSDVQPAP